MHRMVVAGAVAVAAAGVSEFAGLVAAKRAPEWFAGDVGTG